MTITGAQVCKALTDIESFDKGVYLNTLNEAHAKFSSGECRISVFSEMHGRCDFLEKSLEAGSVEFMKLFIAVIADDSPTYISESHMFYMIRQIAANKTHSYESYELLAALTSKSNPGWKQHYQLRQIMDRMYVNRAGVRFARNNPYGKRRMKSEGCDEWYEYLTETYGDTLLSVRDNLTPFIRLGLIDLDRVLSLRNLRGDLVKSVLMNPSSVSLDASALMKIIRATSTSFMCNYSNLMSSILVSEKLNNKMVEAYGRDAIQIVLEALGEEALASARGRKAVSNVRLFTTEAMRMVRVPTSGSHLTYGGMEQLFDWGMLPLCREFFMAPESAGRSNLAYIASQLCGSEMSELKGLPGEWLRGIIVSQLDSLIAEREQDIDFSEVSQSR